VRAVTVVTPVTNTVNRAFTVIATINFSFGTSLTTVLGRDRYNEIAESSTAAAGDRACSPLVEFTFAVNRARGKLARSGIFVIVSKFTSGTAVLVLNGNSVSTGLVTSTAHIFVGTLVVLTEVTYTVNGTRSGIARLGFNFTIVSVTFKTAISLSAGHTESAEDGSSGAGNITVSEISPFTLAVLRARISATALFVFLKISGIVNSVTVSATVDGFDGHVESLGLDTTATSGRACVEFTPGTNTVNGTSVVVAGLLGGFTVGVRAFNTLVVGRGGHVEGLVLDTAATGDGASIILGPLTFTVDGAYIIITIVTVADFSLAISSFTFKTTMGSGHRHIESLVLVTSVASGGAFVIVRPFTYTVNGTFTFVTCSRVSVGTLLTTVLSLSGDDSITVLGTFLASLRACTVFTPVELTVNRAHPEETILGLNSGIFNGTFASPTRLGNRDNVGAVRETFFAGGGAIRPLSPVTFTFNVGDLAVVTNPSGGTVADTVTVAELVLVVNVAFTMFTTVNVQTRITLSTDNTNIAFVTNT